MNITAWLTHKQVACWNFNAEHEAMLTKALPDARITVCSGADAFLAALPDTEIALIWRFEQKWLAEAVRLKWLVTPAAGRDYFAVDLPDSIKVSYCSFHGELMAETVLAMMLGSCRGVILSAQSSDPWPRAKLSDTMRTLRGSHVVILGFGNIGQWVGRLAKPFGARITGIKRTDISAPQYFDADDEVAGIKQLDNILPTADHLVLALPGGTSTDKIIDRRRLDLLPKHATVYNVGRGNAIDEDALSVALEQGKIAGACLDVFSKEPLPEDAPIRKAPNLLVMPHASAVSPNYLTLFLKEFIQKYRKLTQGQNPGLSTTT